MQWSEALNSQWKDWLAQNASDKRGGVVLPAMVRGEDYVLPLIFPIDLSASTFTGSVALSPDPDAIIADFSVSEGTWDGSVLPVTFTLSSAEDLPEDGDGDGLEEMVFSIEQDGTTIMLGVIPISGRV